MRIISGLLKSRLFRSPPGNRTHPMSERARGAIFNALGDLSGTVVLDAYAGSGSLAFESISRGAERAVAIDIDKKAHRTLSENIESLGLEDQVKATRANIITWAKNTEERFDIIFADPPYTDVNPDHLQALVGVLSAGGLLVVSHPGYFKPDRLDGVDLLSSKSYANANISIMRRMG